MTERGWKYFTIACALLTAGTALFVHLSAPSEPLRTAVLPVSAPAESTPQSVTTTATTYTTSARTTSAPMPTASTAATTPDRNLNTADAAALKRVSGVGDILAEAIVAYRTQNGGFTRRAQLMEIDGIGERLMSRIMAEFEIPNELPPLVTTAPAVTTLPETTTAPVGYYDLNTVTREELLRIPGMTEEHADAILDVREKLHGYLSIYELDLIDGLGGDYILHELTKYLYVENDTVLSKKS